jgi:glycosyltransferase involved in cell wall biosynthesis
MDRLKISAIIPARNEEVTVGPVVTAVKAAGFFDKVIVVSDGSTDRTVEQARQAGADKVIELSLGRGKGAALSVGVAATESTLLCFLDADLMGLTAAHLKALVEPVLSGRWVMSVGMWDRGRWQNAVARLLPLVSGQRAMRREVFADLPKRAVAGYRAEIAMNRHCRRRGWRFGRVFLPGLKVRQKPDKLGLPAAIVSYFRMFGQVLLAMFGLESGSGPVMGQKK